MNDYYLKADSAQALYDVLGAAGVVIEGDQGWHVADGHKYALDVIGEIADVAGFHANLRVMTDDFDADKIAEIVIEPPSNPVRGWA